MSLPAEPDVNEPRTPQGPGGGGAAVLDREEQLQEAEPGDHERFAHYVRKEKITESAVTGDPVVALCGKVWTPGRDPERFPVCPECKEIYEDLQAGGDGKGGSGGGGRGWFGRGGKN
ncbi:DUF3039 domain-containing protein [Citricoccus sp. GCM10030269]|uniref:DUF3039 domain-containing protein n=1 Tax=Citricoccus sp. GCM10030269 TaxID=3273388 RepID=UPI003620A9D4